MTESHKESNFVTISTETSISRTVISPEDNNPSQTLGGTGHVITILRGLEEAIRLQSKALLSVADELKKIAGLEEVLKRLDALECKGR